MIGRHRAHRRVYAVSFATVFTLVGWADATGLHFCPQHDGLPVAASGTTAEVEGPGHHAEPTSAHTGSGHDEHEGPCTCVGNYDDQGTALQTLVRTVAFVDSPASQVGEERARSALLTAPRYQLPFANAPPRLT